MLFGHRREAVVALWLIVFVVGDLLLSTNLKDTVRAAMMGVISTSCGASSHLFIYSGTAPAKTSVPTGTSAIAAGIPLGNPMGTVAAGTLTLASVPLSGMAAASITPGYYRVVDGAADDGTHTQIQGPCAVIAMGSGTASVTGGGAAIAFSATQTGLIGSYVALSGDTTNGIYQVASGSGTSWVLATPYGGSTNSTATWGTATLGAINFWSQIAAGGLVSINACAWTEGDV